MSNVKKLMMTAAGGEALNVENVFSTYVYDGNSSNRSITNGIDLSTEGGMVWIKGRTSTTYDFNNTLFDTERGAGYRISTDLSDQQRYNNNSLTSFNTDGFSLGTDGSLLVNWSSNDYVSWTWRKAPKFFDVVTYTGTGSTPQTISHNLGSVPGCIIIKRTDGNVLWVAYHRGLNGGVNPEQYSIQFNESTGETGGYWNNTAPTSTEFTVIGSQQVGGSGMEYVAYLFAHNDDDGEFGPNGDADIIKCGYYTGTGASGNSIDLGFEPQWLMIRRTNGVGSNAFLYDTMRGMFINTTGSGSVQELQANSANKERDNREGPNPLSNGFRLDTTSSSVNGTNDEYIYIAIRRGPMAVPESATDVFHVATGGDVDTSAPHFRSGFPVDMGTFRILNQTYDTWLSARLMQNYYLKTNTNSGNFYQTLAKFDYSDGWFDYAGTNSNWISHMWKRAPNFFDVVCRDGTNNTSDTITHNLSAVPELIITKRRNTSNEWYVAHEFGSTSFKRSYLEQTLAASSHNYTSGFFHVGQPTDTEYYLNGNNPNYNQSGSRYIDFLFCSLDGVSKVGTYTGNGGSSGSNGSSQNIDCGFSAGASFVLIKRTDSTGDWYVFDSERGIVSGNDPYIKLNSSNSEQSLDTIDPYNSGFTINQYGLTNLNVTNATYLFYAIEAI
jgi:hypothetical protein